STEANRDRRLFALNSWNSEGTRRADSREVRESDDLQRSGLEERHSRAFVIRARPRRLLTFEVSPAHLRPRNVVQATRAAMTHLVSAHLPATVARMREEWRCGKVSVSSSARDRVP